MDRVLKDRFEFRDLYDKHTDISKALVIKPSIIANAASYIRANKIESVFIDGAIMKEDMLDISILNSCATIKALSVGGAISGLQVLLQVLPLQWLAIDNTLIGEKIDLSSLTELQYLSIYKMNNKISGLSKLLALKNLRAWSFTSPTGNLEILHNLSQLTEIELNFPKIMSLDGISQLTALRKLHICYCRNSIDLQDVFASRSIEYIEIEKGNPTIPETIKQSHLFELVFKNGHYVVFQRNK